MRDPETVKMAAIETVEKQRMERMEKVLHCVCIVCLDSYHVTLRALAVRLRRIGGLWKVF